MKSMDRIAAIRQSLNIFICGIVGLVPVIGLLPATIALFGGFRLRREYSAPNPANHYRKWGMVLGICGILISIYTVIFVAANIIASLQHGDTFMD